MDNLLVDSADKDFDTWVDLETAYRDFAFSAPVLKLRTGPASLLAFLKDHKDKLIELDVIRLAHGRRWIARQDRFARVAFDLLTGAVE